MVQGQVTVPYTANYDVGIGVDLATGSPMGMVVQGAVSGVDSARGATTFYKISRIHSTSELESTLGINVEASMGCGCFSASARLDFARRAKIQTSSLFMAITAQVKLGNLSIDDPHLTPEAAEIANQYNVFSNRFGNMFVRGIERGGLFVGVIQINTDNSEEAQSIAVELDGSYGLFSADVKAKFEEVQKRHRSEILIAVYHEGGPIGLAMKDITDASELYTMMQNWLQSFQDNSKENSVPYYVTLAPIAIANGPIPPNRAQIQYAQDVLMMCAKERSKILDELNLGEFILRNPSHFDLGEPTTLADVEKSFRGCQADLDLVAATASHAINNVTQAMTPVAFAQTKGQPYPQGTPLNLKGKPPPLRSTIIIHASQFARGENIEWGGSKASEVLHVDRNNRYDEPVWAEFDIPLSAAESGKYRLLATYTSWARRPVIISWNGLNVSTDALTTNTGSWGPSTNVVDEDQGIVVNAIQGTNVLRIWKGSHIPHITSFKLVPENT